MDFDKLRALVARRIAGSSKVYRVLFERVVRQAGTAIPPREQREQERDEKNLKYRQEQVYGSRAKSAAFLHWLKLDGHEIEFGKTACLGLEGMRTDIPSSYLKQVARGVPAILSMSESLTVHAQAYHYLGMAGMTELDAATRNLTELAESTEKLVGAILRFGFIPEVILKEVTKHNYLLKGSAAVALAGLYLERPDLVEIGQKGIRAVLRTQGPALERGWGEGADYLSYASVNFLPYMLEVEWRRRNGQTHLQNVELEDYFRDPVWQAVFTWFLKIRMPSGERPGVDDAIYRPFFSGLLANLYSPTEAPPRHFNVPAYFWAWDWQTAELSVYAGMLDEASAESRQERYEQEVQYCSGSSIDLSPDFLIHYSDQIPLVEPTGAGYEPNQMSLACGQAVLRSGWNREAVYLLLQGESGKMVQAGGRHEHNDATSFILCAYGELLALDPGYPNWELRHLTNRPEHHSRILIEGLEPESDAALDNFFVLETLAGARATAKFTAKNHQQPRHERSVIFVNQRFFVIDDVLAEIENRQAIFRLHGFGELDRAPATAALRLHVWRRPQAALHALVATSDGTMQYTYESSPHGMFPMGKITVAEDVPQHAVLKAWAPVDLAQRFFSLLYPVPAGVTPPQVSALRASEGRAILLKEQTGEGECHTICAFKNDPNAVAVVQTPLGEVSYDGNFLLLTFDPLYRMPRALYCDNADHASWKGRKLLHATDRFHGVLEWDHRNAAVYGRKLSTGSSQQLEILTRYEPVSSQGLRVLEFDGEHGMLSVQVDSDTRSFQVNLAVQPFHRLELMPTTGIHPWLPFGDGALYEHDGEGLLLQREAPSAATTSFGFQRKHVTIQPHTLYRLQCQIKTQLRSGHATCGMGKWLAGNAVAGQSEKFGGDEDFQEATAEWQSRNSDTEMELRLTGSADFAGQAWFKAATLTAVSPQNLDFRQLDDQGFPRHFQIAGNWEGASLAISREATPYLRLGRGERYAGEFIAIGQRRIPVIPGCEYRCSCEVALAEVTAGTIVLAVIGSHESMPPKHAPQITIQPGLGKWQKLSLTWTAGELDTLCDLWLLTDAQFAGLALVQKLHFERVEPGD